ncbi:5-(carboxyamino)imidazole ribonucleotide synthase [Immundisolibacter sp.]|uniref:5-(carboxyamino)imidazole ribonucleotide synthase n=1 Tax=Immundisolibacter sp. TaxID=1934948 RepID=UPI002609F43A|nr:5-(carboxyamino)imidazole ribonucleotide synthase [Immundisolibacter sp.]MDD3651146.1 5-(carboxyamino)imidazole ribonucleotide synthase [Immundisolibacter sp.]
MRLPGSTIGVLGGGQLGRMLAMEARRMGYRVRALDPDPDACAAPFAELTRARLDDVDAALQLAAQCDVLTIETEHVPAAVLAQLETVREVHPNSALLATVQDRLRQRQFLARHGLPQTAWAQVDDLPGLERALAALGCPAVLKTRTEGYDGKGQVRIGAVSEAADAWAAIASAPAVLEAWVGFEREISVILARGGDGDIAVYPVAENEHRRHVLHITRAPARVAPAVAQRARELGAAVAEALGHVGVMAVEMFLLPDGELLVNEIAPRTHNSGHYTFGGCVTSQFEQHLRAICGLPLGEVTQAKPALMLNLLGDLWADGAPPLAPILAHPGARLHLYGKAPRPGRKLGHVLVLTDDLDQAQAWADGIVG